MTKSTLPKLVALAIGELHLGNESAAESAARVAGSKLAKTGHNPDWLYDQCPQFRTPNGHWIWCVVVDAYYDALAK